MIFQYLNNTYTQAHKETMLDLPFKEQIKIIGSPTIGNKDTRNAIVPACFNYGVLDHVPRNKETVNLYSGLILDYDDGDVLINDWEEKHNFEYFLYTSYSHTQQKHKFHVVVPLKHKITKDQLYNAKSWLLNKFEGCDRSTFTRSRLFYIAGYDGSQQSIDDFYSNYSDGERFDIPLSILNPVPKTLTPLQIVRNKMFAQQKESKYYKNDIESAIERIKENHTNSLHHDDIRAICSALKTVNIPRQEIEHILSIIKSPQSKEDIKKTYDQTEANHNTVATLFYLSRNLGNI